MARAKSLPADEARQRLRRVRTYDAAAEVVTKVHGPELERLRQHYRVKPGLEPVVQHRIIAHVVNREV